MHCESTALPSRKPGGRILKNFLLNLKKKKIVLCQAWSFLEQQKAGILHIIACISQEEKKVELC